MYGRFGEPTEEVEGRILHSELALELAVHLFPFAVQLARPRHEDDSPCPKRCIVLV